MNSPEQCSFFSHFFHKSVINFIQFLHSFVFVRVLVCCYGKSVFTTLHQTQLSKLSHIKIFYLAKFSSLLLRIMACHATIYCWHLVNLLPSVRCMCAKTLHACNSKLYKQTCAGSSCSCVNTIKGPLSFYCFQSCRPYLPPTRS